MFIVKLQFTLFHVFNYYRTSLQIFLFHQLFHKSFSSCIRNSKKFFNLLQKQPPEVFHKKAILKHFVIFTGKRLCWGLFFNKVTGHQTCIFIKKRLQHVFLWILGNLLEHLFWRTFANGCIFGKCLLIIFFRSELRKRNFW